MQGITFGERSRTTPARFQTEANVTFSCPEIPAINQHRGRHPGSKNCRPAVRSCNIVDDGSRPYTHRRNSDPSSATSSAPRAVYRHRSGNSLGRCHKSYRRRGSPFRYNLSGKLRVVRGTGLEPPGITGRERIRRRLRPHPICEYHRGRSARREGECHPTALLHVDRCHGIPWGASGWCPEHVKSRRPERRAPAGRDGQGGSGRCGKP